jgi:hypothetical protein
MIKKSSASIKFDIPTLKTSADTKPQKTNIRVPMLKSNKSKKNIIKKK